MRAGFAVVEAADGQAGLDLLERLVPDIVVTDVAMPRLDGVAFVRTMAANVKLAQIPILIMTSHASSMIPTDYPILEKPFSLHRLVDAIEKLIM